jgi:hypothetical protein
MSSVEVKKNKRGRPRKNPQIEEPKQSRARKTAKKPDGVFSITRQPVTESFSVPVPVIKSYIVQLRFKLSDISSDSVTPVTPSTDTYSDYTSQETPETADPVIQLPEIPQLYTELAIPLQPNQVPVKLFSDNIIAELDTNSVTELPRNTSNLLLPLFKSNEEKWPEKSHYACWNCDVTFSNQPIGIPDREKSGTFYCYGNFCRFECAARYLYDRESMPDFINKYSLLCIMYQKAYGLPPHIRVNIAPPRESLLKYGGILNHREYHQVSQEGSNRVEIYKLPMVPVMLHIEEVSKSVNISNLLIGQGHGQSTKTTGQVKGRKTHVVQIDPVAVAKAEEAVRQRLSSVIKTITPTFRTLKIKDPVLIEFN